MSELKLKEVEAVRTGSYDGHRRRAGARFFVDASAKEDWFIDIGPAPEGAELPGQLQNAQAPRGKSFIDLMRQLGKPQLPQPVREQTLAEARDEVLAGPKDQDLVV